MRQLLDSFEARLVYLENDHRNRCEELRDVSARIDETRIGINKIKAKIEQQREPDEKEE